MKKIFNIFLGIFTLIFCLSIFNTASALNVVFSEDRPDLRTLDPRITQSRHEEMIIVQMFDQLISADSNGNLYVADVSNKKIFKITPFQIIYIIQMNKMNKLKTINDAKASRIRMDN